jgi:hypothetical protein
LLLKAVGNPLIVTLSDPLPAVLAVVHTPEPLITIPSTSAILITTPEAGILVGKLSSSAITSRPPIGAICAAT